MYLTEEEAKTKWCPMARNAGVTFRDTGMAVSVNRDCAEHHGAENCNCIGSACAAWRWVAGKVLWDETDRPSPSPGSSDIQWIKNFLQMMPEHSLRLAKDTHDALVRGEVTDLWLYMTQPRGYCGAFGKPEA